MFKKSNRLQSSVLGGGLPKKISIGPFLVRFGKNNLIRNRFAVIIGKKNEKTAVGRHVWQRQIREKLKKWPNLGIDVAISCVCSVKDKNPRVETQMLVDGYRQITKKL